MSYYTSLAAWYALIRDHFLSLQAKENDVLIESRFSACKERLASDVAAWDATNGPIRYILLYPSVLVKKDRTLFLPSRQGAARATQGAADQDCKSLRNGLDSGPTQCFLLFETSFFLFSLCFCVLFSQNQPKMGNDLKDITDSWTMDFVSRLLCLWGIFFLCSWGIFFLCSWGFLFINSNAAIQFEDEPMLTGLDEDTRYQARQVHLFPSTFSLPKALFCAFPIFSYLIFIISWQ